MIECSLIDLIPEVRHPMVPFDLVTWSTILKVRVVSNHSVLPSAHGSVLPCDGSVLLSLLLGRLNCNYVCALLLWGLLLVSTSRHSVEVQSVSNLSALTCKSALQSCLRIHLDCLTALLEQSIWSSRLPQEVQRRSSM